MANHKPLDVELVKRSYIYRVDGKIIYKNSDNVPAGYILPIGYEYVYVGKRLVTSQRVVWALHHGDPGNMDIDHINGDKLDNRIENLRLVTRSQNNQNRHVRGNWSAFRYFQE